MREYYDVCVIGAGPAGLGAAAAAAEKGASVAVFERSPRAGGVLGQCIHDGFGLYRYGTSLSGPEYARLALSEAEDAELFTGTSVTGLTLGRELTAVSPRGLHKVRAGAVVLATGCRERTREALMIPGTRPAGIFTAGTAQELMNLRGHSLGKRAVILGSGDIGLIVARRMTLRGMEVAAICEAAREPSGLTRNVIRCARELDIPILTGTTVSRVLGSGRVTGVELADADSSLRPIPGTERTLECDTLILSVGLIPERELLPDRDGARLAENGIFLSGNCRRIEQLADLATLSGESAGSAAADFARGIAPTLRDSLPELPPMPTGFPPPGVSAICTGCPRGCSVSLLPDGTVRGNLCPRGAQEALSPERLLTLTLKDASGRSVALRTEKPIPLALHRPESVRLSRLTVPRSVPGEPSGLFAAGVPLTVTGLSPY